MNRLDGAFLEEAYPLAWRQPPDRLFQTDVVPDDLVAVVTRYWLGCEMVGSVPL